MVKIKDIINQFGGIAKDAEEAATGQIAFANITQAAPATEHLTQFAVKYSMDDNNAAARRHLAPDAVAVTDGSAFEYRYWPIEESLLTYDHDALKRAVGGDYLAVGDKSEMRTGSLDDIGLCVAVEKRHLEQIRGYREALIKKMVGIIERATLIKAISLFSDIATESTISVASNPNPDAALREAITDSVVRPNRALYGPKAWDLRTSAYENAELTAGALRASETPEALGNRLGLDILVPNGRKAVAAGSYPYILADTILLGYGVDGASMEDPSNLKVFRSKGIEVFESEHPQGKKELITVSTSQAIQVTSTLGAYAIKITA